MRRNGLGVCSAVAAVVVVGAVAVVPANATTLSLGINWGPVGPNVPIVGMAVKVDSGSASVQSITNGATTDLPPGWFQQSLADSFAAGTNPNASSSQYGFVRGGGGSTYDTADSYGAPDVDTPLGFTASFLLDADYDPEANDTVVVLWTTFRGDNGQLSAQGKHTFTFDGSAWNGENDFGPFWSPDDSGTFNQFSAAVVPGSGIAAIGTLGVAGVARRRRR